MANQNHLKKLREGVRQWNKWRSKRNLRPDLAGAKLNHLDLRNADLGDANLKGADLSQSDLELANFARSDLSDASLKRSNLGGADFSNAKLRRANLRFCDLWGGNCFFADLRKAKLSGAHLRGVNFGCADLTGADLVGADLCFSHMNDTVLRKANLTGCFVYGMAVWDVDLDQTVQSDLCIIDPSHIDSARPKITVDRLEIAQFLYLLLTNREIRHVIDTITSKVVLILGRFTPERKAVLDAIRDELRKRDYLPVLFDFEKPSSRDITDTVSTLAHMAKFVIADITDAKSIPQELMAIVPALPSVPVQPVLLASQREYGMFEHFKRFPWVLRPYLYKNQDRLLAALNEKVIGPAETKAREQTGR